MSFAVFTGGGGYTGWRILSRTSDQQKALIAAEPQVTRATEHFQKRISTISNAEDLVKDYQLLSVALKAHGLEHDIGNNAFIRKILESDLSDPKSLANRLSDQRYIDLARDFGFTAEGSDNRSSPDFVDRIKASYIQAEFELRVGETDNDMRVALTAQRELSEIAASEGSEESKWLRILGSPPLLQFMQKALGYDTNLSKLPIDSQIDTLKAAAKRQLGVSEISEFSNPDRIERAIGLYLARAQLDGSGSGHDRFSTALALLR